MGTGVPQVQSRQVRVSPLPAEAFNGVARLPTLLEAGVKGIEDGSWYGLFAPAGTPRDIVARLQREIAEVLKSPDVVERLRSTGNEPVGSTPAEFDALFKADLGKFAKSSPTRKFRNWTEPSRPANGGRMRCCLRPGGMTLSTHSEFARRSRLSRSRGDAPVSSEEDERGQYPAAPAASPVAIGSTLLRWLTACNPGGNVMVTLRAKPEPLDIDLEKAAIIVVDMQNSFVSKGGMFDLAGFDIAGSAPVIEVNRRLLTASRKAGVKVVYLMMAFKPDLSDAGDPSSPAYHKELALRMMRDRPELAGRSWWRIPGTRRSSTS